MMLLTSTILKIVSNPTKYVWPLSNGYIISPFNLIYVPKDEPKSTNQNFLGSIKQLNKINASFSHTFDEAVNMPVKSFRKFIPFTFCT